MQRCSAQREIYRQEEVWTAMRRECVEEEGEWRGKGMGRGVEEERVCGGGGRVEKEVW